MPPYTITQTGKAIEQFKRIVDMARFDHRLDEIVKAGKLLLQELVDHPNDCGESRGEYPVIRVTKRVGFFGPLTVYYGVDETRKLVTIVGFWLPKRKSS